MVFAEQPQIFNVLHYAKNSSRKEAMLKELEEQFDASKSVVFFHHRSHRERKYSNATRSPGAGRFSYLE